MSRLVIDFHCESPNLDSCTVHYHNCPIQPASLTLQLSLNDTKNDTQKSGKTSGKLFS